MTNFIESSIIFSGIKKLFDKISKKWNESQIGWLVTRNLNDVKSESSYVYKILNFLINKTFSINIGGSCGEKIKNSVILNALSHYEVGVYLLIFLIPIIPTMACVSIALITLFLFFINSIIKNDFNIKIDAFVLVTLILLITIFVYSITSYSYIASLKVFLVYASFIIFMLITISCGCDKKRFNIMINLFILSGFVVSLYGIYQKFFGNNLGHAWIDTSMFTDISMRVYSTFGNPNVFGQFLLLLIPICGAMIYNSRRLLVKFYYFLVMTFSLCCIVLTHSRGCWIGLILSVIIFAFLVDKKILGFCVIAFLILPFVLPDSIINRFLSIGNMGDSSTSYRVNIWLGTLNMLKDYWLFGVGVGTETFNKVYPLYSLEAAFALHSHNFYLQVFSELGISGLITFVICMAISLKKILIGYLVDKKSKYGIICAAILAGMVGLLLEGMFDYVWYNFRFFAIFWLVIGLGIAARRCACDEDFTHNK